MFRPPKPVGMELNLAPMVDVMMCLIIFFLLASKLVSAEQHPVQLPFAVAAQEVATSELGNRVTIGVRPTSGVAGNAAEYVVVEFTGDAISERALTPEALNQYLAARAAAAARGGESDLRCVIRADKDVEYKDVEVVLRACGLAKIAKIVFTAKQGLDPEGPS